MPASHDDRLRRRNVQHQTTSRPTLSPIRGVVPARRRLAKPRRRLNGSCASVGLAARLDEESRTIRRQPRRDEIAPRARHDRRGKSALRAISEVTRGQVRRRAALSHEQTMAEYAVVLGVITIAVVVTLGLLAGQISNVLNSVVTAM
jgi:hypothetical protein